jgi:N6-L-threonylcarbamoyladenine synthase
LSGEAYDKVARMLGLELNPHGGAALEAAARLGDASRYALSVPMQKHANCDFSFAGLKTGVRLCIESELPPEGDPGERGWGGSKGEGVGYVRGGVWSVVR